MRCQSNITTIVTIGYDDQKETLQNKFTCKYLY